MLEWAIAIVVFLGLLALLPRLMRRSRKLRKGMAGGVVMGLGLAFMTIFDPAKAATVEEVRKHKDLGDADAGESGEGLE